MNLSDVTAHLAQAEYLKTLAKAAATRLLAGLTVEEIATDDAAGRKLVDELLTVLYPYVRDAAAEAAVYAGTIGYEALAPAESASIVSDVLGQLGNSAQPAVDQALAEMRAQVLAMESEGIAQAVIQQAVSSEAAGDPLTARLSAVLSAAGSSAVVDADRLSIETAVEKAEAAGEGKAAKEYGWITVHDENVCEDTIANSCAPREAVKKTLADWRALGMPGAPNLICSIFSKAGVSNCRCFLRLVAEDGSLGPFTRVDGSKFIKQGRERAQTELGA